MNTSSEVNKLLLSQYETKAYLSLVAKYPLNGSKLSKHSGIPSAKIYEVLRNLLEKGIVTEVGKGIYAPLPPEELLKNLRHGFGIYLNDLEEKIKATSNTVTHKYVWTIQGYDKVIAKAKEMISSARTEIYVELYPDEGRLLDQDLHEAVSRGVKVKYVSMGHPSSLFDLQVVHPGVKKIRESQGGRIFDVIVDMEELLVGLFEKGKEDHSPISWAKNNWFVTTIREFVRHDFFHYFLYKIQDRKEELSEKEKRLYELIKNDAWDSSKQRK